ncbi:MAG TPA: hypothetical protein VF629_14340 [Hymenobacter sp.]
MKLAACLVACLVGFSCNKRMLASGKGEEYSIKGKFDLISVAVDEHRYLDAEACENAAKQYHGNNHDDSPDGNFKKVSDSPLTYAWKAKNIEVEIRFVVLPANEVQQPGEILQYWRINKKSGNNKKDIEDAIGEFKGNPKRWTLVKGAVADGSGKDGKPTYRAVMNKKPKSQTPESKPEVATMLFLRQDDIGIIINPPYP